MISIFHSMYLAVLLYCGSAPNPHVRISERTASMLLILFNWCSNALKLSFHCDCNRLTKYEHDTLIWSRLHTDANRTHASILLRLLLVKTTVSSQFVDLQRSLLNVQVSLQFLAVQWTKVIHALCIHTCDRASTRCSFITATQVATASDIKGNTSGQL